MTGPLNGIKVLEFTQIIAGPLGCMLLADLGAEVVKVEPPQGEPWRLQGQFIPFESKTFQSLNRGKQSLSIDVSRPEAQAAIHKLVAGMDVVVINYRPDVAARLKIDYETLRAIKPDLIYVDNTAFGREGPWADRPGYDIVVQAASGLTAAVGKVDDQGAPVVGPAVADATTGYALAWGVTAALFHRERTGEGQMVETSLLTNALMLQHTSFMELPAADAAQRSAFKHALDEARANGTPYAEFLQERTAILRAAAGAAIYYRNFLTKDGAIAIGALSAGVRQRVREALGVDHNRDEEGYDPLDLAQRERDLAITEEVVAMIRAESTEHWVRLFEQHRVPVSPVYFVQELVDQEQVLANGYVVELEHDLTGPQRMAAPPLKMSATPPEPTAAAPPLGRDTDSILAGVGYSDDEIAALRNGGVIR
jgi:CoA:oxalate CoA-transferase